jgi:hypothetical protein
VVFPELLAGIFAGDSLENFEQRLAVFALGDSVCHLLFFPPGCSSWNLVKS